MLDNFFSTLNSNHLDSNDAWFGGATHNKETGSYRLEWPDDLPPTFEGSTTSLSQPSMLPYSSSKGDADLMGNLGPGSDVFAAASMLYQNGINAADFGGSSTQHMFSENVGMSAPLLHTGYSKQGHTRQHHATDTSRTLHSRHHLLRPQHTSVFNVEESVPLDPQTSRKFRTLRWGSDSGFVDQGYVRPPDMPNEEERTQDLLENMECLEPQTSTTNTRAPTPVKMFENPHSRSWDSLNGAHLPQILQDGNPETGKNVISSKRRLKTKSKAEEDSDETSTTPRTKRPKSSGGGKARGGSSDTSSRKPKEPQGNKSARENLTEEQKRTNHILSEQKRRNLIKQGFDELCSIVPELRGGGFSKSAMLLQAADWLEETLKGNEELRHQLSQLKAMNGFMMR